MSDDYRPEGYTTGRPSKYKPEYCETVIALGSEGKSKTEIAFELGVDRTTLHEWTVVHPEFSYAITRAKEAEQVWWERIGRQNLTAREFQSSMWSRSMSARFPDEWRESTKQEIVGKDGAPLIPTVNVSISRLKS